MLQGLVAVGALGASPVLAACTPLPWPGLRTLGQAHLTRHPDEATVDALVALLPAGVDPAALPDVNLRLVQPDVHADFTAGRTAHVDGWVLSLTELRVCALWALRPVA